VRRSIAIANPFGVEFWKILILHHAAERPIVAQGMLDELREQGLLRESPERPDAPKAMTLTTARD
jgi:hypothetical protein